MTKTDAFCHDQGMQRNIALAIAAMLAVILHFAIFFSAYNSKINLKDEEQGNRAVVISLVSLPVANRDLHLEANVPEIEVQKEASSQTSNEKKVESNPDLSSVPKMIAKAIPDKKKAGKKKQKQPETTRRLVSETSVQAKQVQARTESDQAVGMQNPVGSDSDPVLIELPFDQIRNRKPLYPEIARQRGQEGKVILLAKIDRAGHVTGLGVTKSSGYQMLDEAAIKSVRQWRFKPAMRAGVAVEGKVSIPVDFKLK